MHELVEATSGWLSWYAWLLILAAIVAIASFEFAVRKATPRKKPNNTIQIDDESRELAGLVNALLERAGSYSFKLPLPADDPFVKQYEELDHSAHPVWTDPTINQLRRDFRQYCGIVGEQLGTVREQQNDRAELHRLGRKLIAALKGEAPPVEYISLREAARKFYEEFRGTNLGEQLEGGPDQTPDGILEYAASWPFEECSIEVKRPPSSKWEPLPASEKQRLITCDGGSGLKYLDDDHATFTEARLTTDNLAALIDAYKKVAKRS